MSAKSKGSELTTKKARAIARDAYIFTFPQVYYYWYAYLQAIDATAEDYFGGLNVYMHFPLSTPDTHVGVPNNDTPYSRAWVDTRAEPLVLTMPPVEEDRFYTAVWADFWGFIVDYPGSIIDGNGGGDYLLASPTWEGALPNGIRRVIRGETQLLGTVTRTQIFGPDDVQAMEQVQQGYKLQPLSQYLGQSAPPPAPELAWPEPAADALDDLLKRADAFFPLVNFLLTLTKPYEADAKMYKRMAKIGLEAGKPWDINSMSPAIAKAIQSGAEDGLAMLNEYIQATPDASEVYGDRESMGTDYLERASGVLAGGLAPNVPEQAVYFQFPVDDHGEAPDGSQHKYTITFAPGHMPPVNYFWSVTSYSLPDRWLVANPIHRYSIGIRTPGLKTEPDGSLVLYLQKDPPVPGRLSNWLPINDGPVFEILRLYGPHAEVLDGTWKAPELVRVD